MGGLLFDIIGLGLLFGAIFDWDFLMDRPTVEAITTLTTRKIARIVCAIFGIIMIAISVLTVLIREGVIEIK